MGVVRGSVIVVAAIFPRPLPTAQGIAGMPWWAPLGGLIGAVAVVTGLLFVDRVGADLVADQLRRTHPRLAQDVEVTPAVQPTSLTYSSNGRNPVASV